MGQRLVLSIDKGDQTIANAYYHWSGYTGPAVHTIDQIISNPEARKLIDKIKHSDDDAQNKVDAIRLLDFTESRLTPEDEGYMKEIAPNETFEISKSRNDGLTNVSKQQMDDADGWAEMTATIDVATDMVHADVFFVDNLHYLKTELEYTDEEINELPLHEKPSGDIPFDQFDEFKKIIYDVLDNRHTMFRTPSGTIISFIA